MAGESLQVQGTGLAETQTLNLSGGTPGTTTFTLSFNGATTSTLTYTGTATDASNIQNALDALSTIGGLLPVAGSVNVSQVLPGVWTLTFGGSLASTTVNQPPLALTVTSGTGTSNVLTNLNAPLVVNGQDVAQTETLTFTGATSGTKYALSFNGVSTGTLTYGGTASDATTMTTALNGLSTIAGVNGSVTVTYVKAGTFTIVFGGNLTESLQPAVTAAITSGLGSASTLTNLNCELDWSNLGPAPVLSGETAGSTNVSGRITGIAPDPSDANTIYVATAGGGVWKTINGGQTWVNVFDVAGVQFCGAIAVSTIDPRIIYVGTGESEMNQGSNGFTDSYYGTGVYESTNSGQTWTLLTNANGSNPLYGLTVSKIVVDAKTPGLIYVATGDQEDNLPTTAGTPGVYRYSGNTWLNLTGPTATITASADTFAQSAVTWSDLAVDDVNGSIYAALGSPNGGPFGTFAPNDIYTLGNAASAPAAAVWTEMDILDPSLQTFGTIKFALDPNVSPVNPNTNPEIYALVAGAGSSVVFNGVLEFYKTTVVAPGWAAVTVPAGALSADTNYAMSITMVDDAAADTVYIGGDEDSTATHVDMIEETTNGGGTWTDLSVDGNKNGPENDVHAMVLDANGNLDIGSDGGIWQLNSGGASPTKDWSDLNGNLDITQVLGVDVNPNNPNNVILGSEDTGVEQSTGPLNEWTWENTNGYLYGAGAVQIDPDNPQIEFAAVSGFVDGQLEESTNGGTTWTLATSSTFAGNYPYFPIEIDPNNPDRIVMGGSSLEESLNNGVAWTSLGSSATSFGIAGFQGTFQADAGFPTLTDLGANTYDPNTIYTVQETSTGSTVMLTKNLGISWVNRTSNLPAKAEIADIIVDPTNEYTAYVVTSNPTGSGIGRVYMTTNSGQSWTNISYNLPDLPTWTLTIDPRTKSGTGGGTLYIGNDNGVYILPNGSTTWQRFGGGLPNVQVRTIELSQNTNTLTIGTYGRGVYQFFLDNVQINNGALLSVSGSPIWEGNVILTGNTTLNSGGTQILQNGTSTTQLTVSGNIGDVTDAAGYQITKIGQGNLILSGANTYSGLTVIQAGVVTVRNPAALGATSAGTIVDSGTALQLQSSLDAEPITLNGNGYAFNGINTGALRNLSGNNTYTGVITLASSSTIGTDSGSTLTIGAPGSIVDGGNAYSLTKEETGTLVLNSASTYGGGTLVGQGVVQVSNGGGLGTGAVSVTNGAQIQVSGGITVPNALTISGTGVGGTGALENTGGSNTWQGNITLASIQGLSTNPVPPTTVDIGSGTAGNILTIAGVVGQTGGTFALTTVGLGTIILQKSDTYAGLTTVSAGILRIQNGKALGTGTSTVVTSGATLQLDGDPTGVGASITVPATMVLTLNGAGAAGTSGALENLTGNNTWAGGVILNTSSTIAADSTTTPTQFTVSGVIANPTVVPNPAPTLTKAGTGTIILTVADTYTGTTSIKQGNLQVDGLVGPVVLNGGTLSGGTLATTGTVGAVTTASNGTLEPGHILASPGTGILTASSVNLTPVGATKDTFFIDLDNTTPGSTSSTGYSTLAVTGNVNLGSAILAGSVTTNVHIGDVFTILTSAGAAGITGNFTSPTGTALTNGSTATIAGRNFTINYVTTAGIVTSVMLTSQASPATMSVALATGSTNPAVYGQPLSFTLTSNIPTGGDVTFTLTNSTTGLTVGAPQTVAVTAGSVTVNSTAFNGGTPPNVGSYGLTVSYAGSAGLAANTTSLAAAEVINQASSSITTPVSSVPSPIVNQGMTFTATVSEVAPSIVTPTGSVTWSIDGVAQSPAATISPTGVVTFSLPAGLGLGGHTILATYPSSTDWVGSSSTLSLTVSLANTTIAVTAPTAVYVYGAPISMSATVTPVAPATTTPTGTVNFTIGGTSYPATSYTNAGDVMTANLVINTLPASASAYTVAATYSGDANYNPNLGTAAVTGPTVNPANTTTVLTTSNNPAAAGQAVQFTATVKSVSPSTATVTGSVTFAVKNNTTLVTTNTVVPFTGGVAVLSQTLTGGTTYAVTATYAASANFNTSTSNTITQTVVAYGTATTLSSSNLNVAAGTALTITATVTKTTGSGTVPAISGPISFAVTNTATMVTTTYSGTVAAGTAKLTFPATGSTALAPGTYSITATYAGSSPNFAASTSNTLTQVVSKAQTTTTLGALPANLASGESVTLTATVTATGLTTTPTGTVTFTVNGTTYTATGVAGTKAGTMTASFTITGGLAKGTDDISASYGGDSNYLGSSSATTVASVGSGGPVTALQATLSTPSPTAAVAFSIAVLAVDSTGSQVITDKSAVTVAIVSGSGKLGGTVAGTFVDGKYTFSALTVSGAATAYESKITSGAISVLVNFTTVTPPPPPPKTGRGR